MGNISNKTQIKISKVSYFRIKSGTGKWAIDMCIYIFDQSISIFYVDRVIFYPNELLNALTRNEDDTIGATLKSNCYAVGLAFSDETPRDGNCFYHAVSSQLGSLGLDENEPLQLRIGVVDYLKENRTYKVKSYPKE